MLGAACESGTLSFWDWNANKNIFNINDHLAPCTSIAFSPVNDSFAASCGLDKKLICHDTKSRKSVFNLVIEQPCTAVDFDVDGTIVAVGTSRGKVVVYDLRNTSHYRTCIQAQNGKVASLSYRPRIDKVNVSQVMSAVKSASKSKLRSQKSLTALKTVEEEIKENVNPDFQNAQTKLFQSEDFSSPAASDTSVFSKRDSISSQLFSPLKEADISILNFTPNPSSKNSSRRGSEVRLSTEGLFSPLREENTSLNLGRRTPFNSLGTPAMSPLTSIQEESMTNSPIKPIISSASFEAEGKNIVEKLSLDTLTAVARSLTCRDVGSPEFDNQLLKLHAAAEKQHLSLPAEITDDIANSAGSDRYDKDLTGSDSVGSSKCLVKPLSSSLCCVIRDEDGRKNGNNTTKLSSASDVTLTMNMTSASSGLASQLQPLNVTGGACSSATQSQSFDPEKQSPTIAAIGNNMTYLNKQLQIVARDGKTLCMDKQKASSLDKELNSVMTAFPTLLLEDSSASPHVFTRPLSSGIKKNSALPSRSYRNTQSGQLHATTHPVGYIHSSATDSHSSNSLEAGTEAQGFNRRYVEEVVNDAMEDWCTNMENRMINMHYSLIRIMQQHQEEIYTFIEEVNGMEALKKENERLKQENEELKRFF